MKSSISSLVALLAAAASALKPARPVPPALEYSAADAASAVTGSGTFQQLLDHADPSKGTFSQSYWWSSQFWNGPGSPVSIYCLIYSNRANPQPKVVMFTPGEVAAAGYTGYLTNRTITGAYAQAIGGAVVIVEREYMGTLAWRTTS